MSTASGREVARWVARCFPAATCALLMVATTLALSTPAGAAGPGDIVTYAGGLGEGPATQVSHGAVSVALGQNTQGGTLVYIADPAANAVRVVDTATGQSRVLAGTGLPRFSGDGGPATSAQLNRPQAVVVDGSGNVLIADYYNNRVRKVDASGVITTLAEVTLPTGLAVDTGANLFVASGWDRRVFKVGSSGTKTVVAGGGDALADGVPATSARFLELHNIAVDASNNLLIPTTGTITSVGGNEVDQHRVRKVVTGVDGVINGGSDETITTVAGTGQRGFSGDGGPAISAMLYTPSDVDVDADGNLFIADATNSRIRKVDTAGLISTVAGTGLGAPVSVDVDAAGNLFIADSINHRIHKVDTTGTITTVSGNGAAGPNGSGFSGDGGPATSAQFSLRAEGGAAIPGAGIVFTGAGIVFTDTGNNRIRRVGPSGTITTVAGNGSETWAFVGDGGAATSAALNQPRGVANDGEGNLFIADSNNHRIRKVDTSGTITTVAGTGRGGFSGNTGPATSAELRSPSGVAVDPFGNLLIADTDNHRIRKVDTDGIITNLAGSGNTGPTAGGFDGDGGPATSALLKRPQGVTTDADGNVFIADTDNFRVRKVDTSGTITTVAGGGVNNGPTGDGGPATSSYLLSPTGVAVDPLGNILIAERDGSRVRKVDTAGIITTVAGSADAYGFGGDGGPATAASLLAPTGVALDPSGNAFILDTGNHRIRKVEGVASPVPTNTPPTATFGASCANLACAFDASASSDPDGTIVSHSWDFGDKANATGPKPTHAYATAGTYTVTLTVSDDDGASASVSRLVTVAPPRLPAADFDANGSTDISVFRPSTGAWYVRGNPGVVYGKDGDVPVPGDYNGDARTDMAVFRPSTGVWYVRGITTVAYGTSGDMPVPGDYNGDGKTDMAVFRPSTGVWYVRGAPAVAYGKDGDIPVPGDYNGDGKTDMAVFRPSTGVWYVRGITTVAYGTQGDMPVPGDYNSDAKTDIAVFRPSTGVWYVRGITTVAYGTQGDMPVPGDYNGDAKTDIAVFRPSNGTWYLRGAPAVAYGTSGDIPLPLAPATRLAFFSPRPA